MAQAVVYAGGAPEVGLCRGSRKGQSRAMKGKQGQAGQGDVIIESVFGGAV